MERPTATNALRIAIIGAGTGGLCLAQGLKKYGFRFSVYDKDSSRIGGLQGYRISISPGGCRALDQNLPRELYNTFLATCGKNPEVLNIVTENFGDLLRIDISQERKCSYKEQSVSRMTLRQVLITGIEDHVHFNKKFSRYELAESGEVYLFFEDGSRETCDILVGADGTNSKVRQQYIPDARLTDSLIRTIGGKVPANDYTRALLMPNMLRGITLLNAPRGYGGILHNMEFPWDEGGEPDSGIGASEAALLKQWPGLMFDNTRDYIMWGFWANSNKFPDNLSEIKGSELLNLARKMTCKWHPNWRALLDATDPESVFPIAVRTSEPVAPWKPSQITLIGDAIHTMTPGRGAGANTALRDAALLTTYLDQVRGEPHKIIDAIARYEREMRNYSAVAVANSRAQMNGRDVFHKPVMGRMALLIQRLSMRIIDQVPPFKSRLARALLRERSQNI
ncbi:NAD(P)/FAD-dependent oxidoreductase [Asaia sp. BMEF1]|uniref:FAD-dependent oxidoreductase n=1 Tax=Asaia sp. BMEF1 TaxID=3155932 RepID=UPI003F678FDE